MNTRIWIMGAALALLGASSPGIAGGRYPLVLGKLRGTVQVKNLDSRGRPNGPWKNARQGQDLGGHLLRTGPHSWAHFRGGPARCVDANSLIRINFDSEASIDVLRGQMSAVDGLRGKSLPDDPL